MSESKKLKIVKCLKKFSVTFKTSVIQKLMEPIRALLQCFEFFFMFHTVLFDFYLFTYYYFSADKTCFFLCNWVVNIKSKIRSRIPGSQYSISFH